MIGDIFEISFSLCEFAFASKLKDFYTEFFLHFCTKVRLSSRTGYCFQALNLAQIVLQFYVFMNSTVMSSPSSSSRSRLVKSSARLLHFSHVTSRFGEKPLGQNLRTA